MPIEMQKNDATALPSNIAKGASFRARCAPSAAPANAGLRARLAKKIGAITRQANQSQFVSHRAKASNATASVPNNAVPGAAADANPQNNNNVALTGITRHEPANEEGRAEP